METPQHRGPLPLVCLVAILQENRIPLFLIALYSDAVFGSAFSLLIGGIDFR